MGKAASSLWIVVGLNKSARTVVFAGMSDDLAKANQIGQERSTNADAPYDLWNEIQLSGTTGSVLHKWLRANGLNKDQAAEAVRTIGAVLLECLPNWKHN